MFLLAVNLGAVLLNSDWSQLAKQDVDVWNSVKNSVVVLLREGIPSGQAALIDKSGLFLASQDVVFTQTTKAKLANGHIVVLAWKSVDPSTQTVLLQAENWKEDAEPVKLQEGAIKSDRAPVLVVLPGGPVRAQLTPNNQLGVLASKKMFSMGEVIFEATAQNIGGGLVFNNSGRLVGMLNATLESAEPSGGAGFLKPQTAVTQNSLQRSLQGNGYGPGQMMVGYTVQSDVLRRIVSGFLSPSHKVQHPAIGVFCKDAPGKGALIMSVREGSPAAKAGLRNGDIILKMDDAPINDQFDFASFMETKDVGSSIDVTISRNFETKTIKLTVGVFQN